MDENKAKLKKAKDKLSEIWLTLARNNVDNAKVILPEVRGLLAEVGEKVLANEVTKIIGLLDKDLVGAKEAFGSLQRILDKLISAEGKCSGCGKPVESDWVYCSWCGNVLKKPPKGAD